MKVRLREKFDAEQWFRGSDIKGIIDEPFKPTGNWHDRFADRPDTCLEENRHALKEGDWIVTDSKGNREVWSNDEFHKRFKEIKPNS